MIIIKICVYAICKNEEKFVERWVNSMKEADNIYVLDTGSTDNTVKKLKDSKLEAAKKAAEAKKAVADYKPRYTKEEYVDFMDSMIKKEIN